MLGVTYPLGDDKVEQSIKCDKREKKENIQQHSCLVNWQQQHTKTGQQRKSKKVFQNNVSCARSENINENSNALYLYVLTFC